MDPTFRPPPRRRGFLALASWMALLPMAALAQDYYQREGVELQIVHPEAGQQVYLTLTRREGFLPPETLAAGVPLSVSGQTAKNEASEAVQWQVSTEGATARVTAKGTMANRAEAAPLSGDYAKVTPEARLAGARERAGRLDAELNRIYGEVRGRLPADRGNSLRDGQREWIHFTYEPAEPRAEAGTEEWLSRGDRSAERIRFLQGYTKDAAAAEAQTLRQQLAAAETADAWHVVGEIARRLLLATPRDSALWEKRVNALIETENWTRAEGALKEWAAAVPKPPAVIDDLRGDVADGQEKPEEAIRFWMAYAKAEPKEGAVRTKLGEALSEKGDWAGALPYFEQSAKLEPTASAWAELAEARAVMHDWPRMSAEIRKGSKLDDTDDTVKEKLPRIERLERALPEVKAADARAAANRAETLPLIERGMLFLRLEWPELVLADAEAALKVNDGSRAAAILKGVSLRALKRDEETEKLLVDINKDPLKHPAEMRQVAEADDLIAAKGLNTQVLLRRAEALNICEQYELANFDAGAALKRDGTLIEAMRAQGIALAKLNRGWESLAALKRVTDAHPQDALAWLVQGEVEADFSRWAPAIECFSRTLAVEPKNVRALRGRQKAYSSLGRRGEADVDAAQLRSVEKS